MAAAINLNDLLQKLWSATNVQQSGQIRPVSDFQNWANEINSELFHEKCAAFQLGQMNTDELQPFMKQVNILVTSLPGKSYDFVTIPSDYEYFIDMRVQRSLLENADIIKQDSQCVQYVDPDYAALLQRYANGNLVEANVEVVDSARWSGAVDRITKRPTFQKPKTTQTGGGFFIAPKGVQSVVLEYFRTPRACVYGYTIGTGDIIVYDANTSIQLEWTNQIQNEFLTRLIKKYGVRVRDMQVYQTAEADKTGLK